MDEKSMIIEYLSLAGGDGILLGNIENAYVCRDQYGTRKFLLEVIDGKIYCGDTDCIDLMKFAYDYDSEIMKEIALFEKKWNI